MRLLEVQGYIANGEQTQKIPLGTLNHEYIKKKGRESHIGTRINLLLKKGTRKRHHPDTIPVKSLGHSEKNTQPNQTSERPTQNPPPFTPSTQKPETPYPMPPL